VFVGIDIGSVTSKALIIDMQGEVLGFFVIPTGHDRDDCGREVFDRCLRQAKKAKADVQYIVSTGYGRKTLTFSNDTVAEIICHAEGTKALFPEVRTIIDIGGQDSKVIELDDNGIVSRFEMNDKCAAGTGRFLEVLSERILNVKIEDFGALSLKSRKPCVLSSVCTVFAESEVISYLSENRSREDIACGMNRAIAKRVISMGHAAQIAYDPAVCFSGGVAKNIGVVKAIQEELGREVIVPEQPQITACLGAAIFARKNGH